MNRIGIGLEQRQTVRLEQKLVITPQLQQAIKLLQLNNFELAEMLQEELLENPILDEPGDEEQDERQEPTPASEAEAAGEDAPDAAEEKSEEDALEDMDWEAYFEDVDFSRSALPSNREVYDSDLPPIEARLTADETLGEHLMSQLQLRRIDNDTLQMSMLIVGYLNDDGFLLLDDKPKATPEEILYAVADHMTEQEHMQYAKDPDMPIHEERRAHWREVAEEALRVVQSLEPIGVAARSLKECLLIQCRQQTHLKDPDLIERLIMDHLRNLERRNYNAIAKRIKVSFEELIEAEQVLGMFDPRPGRNFTSEPASYITPDIHIKKVGDEYTVTLNDDGLPKLKISQFYKQAMKDKEKSTSKEFVQEKLRSATWLLRSIHQRQRTIHKVTESIIKRQRDFLDKGLQYLKPMILADVAGDIEMHESTISRVTTNKYVHTPQGVFELKFFFTSSLKSSHGGEDISSLTVKEKIKQMIAEEDPKKPLSDQQIVDVLGKSGIKIARRTVAKYRGQLGLASSSRRKKLY